MEHMAKARTAAILSVAIAIFASAVILGVAQSGTTLLSTSTNVFDDRIALSAYEWPQFCGDPEFTRFSAGPAPEAPDVLWKAEIPGIQSYISAFNDKIFVTTMTQVYALDGETGETIWNTTVPSPGPWPTVYKIDEKHMVVGSSCFDPETGRLLWTSSDFSSDPAPLFAPGVYSPYEKMFYVKVKSYVQAWDFSDPDKLPKLAWSTFVPGGSSAGSGVQYGGGMVFPGSYEPRQLALDARTGRVLWDTPTKSAMLFSGAYSDGRFIRAGSHDNTLYCFNASTGTVLWAFTPGTPDGYFCVSPAIAYGMVYMLNKDGFLYAVNMETGKLVWKYEGPGALMFPGMPTVADGKVYATTGQEATYTGKPGASEFACLDAFTGKLFWKLPLEAFAPRESVAIAYGKLYMVPGSVTTAVDSMSGGEYSTLHQVWAFGTTDWPMWRHDAAHSGADQSGPANLTLLWKFKTDGAVVSSPSIAYGNAYFGSQDGNIYALNARNGVLLWKHKTESSVKSSPAVAYGRVYTGTDDGNIYALDAFNGSIVWSAYAGGKVPVDFSAAVQLRSSPTVADGKVYVGALSGDVYCFDAYQGQTLWKFKTNGPITSSPAVAEGALYVSSQEPDAGALYKLDVKNGDVVWKATLPYYVPFTGGIDMHASPVVAGNMVFTSSNTRAYYGLNAETGNVTWTRSDPSATEFIICSPVYEDGKLFLIDKFSIVCVDAATGHTVWETYLGEELYVSPTFAGGKLYVVTDQRSIFVLNASDGSKLSQFTTESNSWSSPVVYEGKVYVGCNDWSLYCLAEYSAIESHLTIEAAKLKYATGEKVTLKGQLSPAIPNATLTATFAEPNGNAYVEEAITTSKGDFNLDFSPSKPGEWRITVSWLPNRGYYTACSNELTLQVEQSSLGYVYVVLASAVAVTLLLVYAAARRIRAVRNRSRIVKS